jgi:hypothetical protein
MLSPTWARAAMSVFLVLFWTGVIVWVKLGRSPAAIAGVLLAIYLVAPMYALLAPTRERDPAMGAAVGMLVFIVVLIVVVGAILAAGVGFHRRGLVWTAFVLTLLPVVAVTIGGVAYAVSLATKR